MKVAMLTTFDNPHDPFNDYDSWYAFDTRYGYGTAAFLARVAVVSPDLSEADQQFAIESAIDEIVQENVNGMYRKVTKEISD